MKIASRVCGIIGLVLFLMPYFGIILSIIATILAVVHNKRKPQDKAVDGLVMGIIGICINSFLLLAVLLVLLIGGSYN